MPKNSFLIEDILESGSKAVCQEEFKGFKKRALLAQQQQQEQHQTKLSPSLSPASFISTTSSSSSSSSSDDNNNLDLDYLKQQYLKQTFPALLLNQYLNSNHNINEQILAGNSATVDYNLLMSTLLQGYVSNSEDSLQLLTNYYTKMFSNNMPNLSQHLAPNYDYEINNKASKRIKLESQNQIYNLDESKLRDSFNSVQSKSNLNTSNNKKELVSGLIHHTASTTITKLTNISPKSNDSIENVSPLDALLQLANSTFINRAGLIQGVNGTTNSSKMNNSTDEHAKSKFYFNKNDDSDLFSDKKSRSNPSSNTSFDSLNESNSKSSSSLNNLTSSTTTTTTAVSTKLPSTSSTSASLSSIANNALKRKRKNRTAFTANQIFELEKRFSTQRYLSPHDRDRIAYELQLTTAQVITWFQNRRAKQKRDLEELKNDVNAAKTLRVIDPDLDVDKIIRSTAGDNDSSFNINNNCIKHNMSNKISNKCIDLHSHNSVHSSDDNSINHNKNNENESDLDVEERDEEEEEEQDDVDDVDNEEINIDNESNLSSSMNNDILNNSADNSVSSPKVISSNL